VTLLHESSLLANLSDEQREVVLAAPGPLLVLAGAGSGKTRALTQRVAYFLHHGIAQERVLLVTFTNQAARQMVKRLQAQAERSLDGMWAGTFHHLAVRVLRRHGYLIGLSERFVILDRHDAADLFASCLSEVAPPPGCAWPRAALLQSLLSLSVNVERPLSQIIATHAPDLAELSGNAALGRVCDRYALRKLQLGLCDFDDLLLGWRLLLCDHKSVRDEQRGQFQHLFIDEYQDTSRIQSAICEDIAQGYRSLTVVGDDAQSIYRFRGAALSNLQEFRARWPDARVLHLSTNYRSQPDIVALSNRSIAKNAQVAGMPRPPMRSAWSQRSQPAPAAMRPAVVGLPDARLQAEFVRKRLHERLADGHSPSEIAVLYRNHRHARELELALLRSQIPYTLRSGQRLAEQTHIKDVLAFLRLCHNPADRLSWARVLRQVFGLGDTGRGRVLAALDEQLGRTSAMPDINDRVLRHARGDSRRGLYRLFALIAELRELLRAATARNKDTGQGAQPSQLIAKLVEHILERHYRDYARHAFADAEQRLADLDGLCSGGASSAAAPRVAQQGLLPLQPADALCDFLSGGAGAEELASAGKPAGVVLSTVHQAKGLEWGIVFVLWLCEGHFPAAAARDEEEEERRLFYVAITRAREELYLCYPSAAAAHGALRRSRFLDELDGPRGEVNPPFERWAVLT
jgi:DNA helicase-2/ATP-dependent DNA helicase PcrA